jgi:hypothetical protein
VLVIEPERLRLLRGKLAPFRLHATMRYPIEEEELDAVLNRMSELMGQPEEEAQPPPEPEPPPRTPTAAPKTQKAPPTQGPGATSWVDTRASGAGKAHLPTAGRSHGSSPAAPRQTSRSALASPPLGAPVPPSPPPVRRKLGNYTPLGSPEDKALRIVERQFDQTVAPLAARAIRTREEASRPRTPKEKLGTLTTLLRDALKKLLRR